MGCKQIKLTILIWVIITLAIAPETWAKSNIVLLMDNSGSMRKNDPEYWSKSSAEFFASRCKPTDSITIIPFDSSLRRNRRLVSANPLKHREKIAKFIKNMDYRGPWTDYHWALREAYKHLKNKEGDNFVILFTDGLPDPDPKDPVYKDDLKNKADKNRTLAMEVVRELYIPNGIKLLAVAFTNKSDINFLKKISYETNKTYDFCFKVDNSYGLSQVFLKISKFIKAISSSFHTDLFVPPSLSKNFLLVNLNRNFGQRQYINQNLLEMLDELSERNKRKRIQITPYRWPKIAEIKNVPEVVRQISKVQKFFIILDFKHNGATAEYFIYDTTNTKKNLYSHQEITMGILSELCGRIATNIFADLKNHKIRKDITIPVTVKYLATHKPAVAEVTLEQSGDKVTEYTDAYGHAIFVADADDPFTITFSSSGLKLGKWNKKDYREDKVFYLAAGYDVSVKIKAIPFDYDDLEKKGRISKKEVIAQIEVETLDDTITDKTPCVIKEVPLGLRKLTVVRPLLLKRKEEEIPGKAYLPFVKYLDVSPHHVDPETNRLEVVITLDKDYLTEIKKQINSENTELIKQKIKKLVARHKDHPQVFEVFSLVSRNLRLNRNYRQALDILVYFQKKYRDKYFYRKRKRLLKDQFLLNLMIAELKLINYLQDESEKHSKEKLPEKLGLSDLRAALGFFHQCQNSFLAENKIEGRRGLEFYLYYGLAEFKAFQQAKGIQGKEWQRYFSRYRRMKEKGKYRKELESILLDTPELQKLLSETSAAYKK